MANDKDVAAMYSFIEDKSAQPYSFSEEELNEFYRHRKKFTKGESKGYSVEDYNYLMDDICTACQEHLRLLLVHDHEYPEYIATTEMRHIKKWEHHPEGSVQRLETREI